MMQLSYLDQSLVKLRKKDLELQQEGIVNFYEDSESLFVLELNSETDFVAKDENFISLQKICHIIF